MTHKQYSQRNVADYKTKLYSHGYFVDVKSQFDSAALCEVGVCVWHL